MQRTTRPAWNVADMPLSLNFDIVNCAAGQAVVWRMIGGVQPAALQQRPQTVHVRNSKNRRWIWDAHLAFIFTSRTSVRASTKSLFLTRPTKPFLVGESRVVCRFQRNHVLRSNSCRPVLREASSRVFRNRMRSPSSWKMGSWRSSRFIT